MKRLPAAIGIDDHSGWAECMIVVMEKQSFQVRAIRRCELVDEGLPAQPFHHTLSFDADAAEVLVTSVFEAARKNALEMLRQIQAENADLVVESIAIRNPPLESLPNSVGAAHASRSLTFSADAMIYHAALCQEAAGLGLEVVQFDRKTVLDSAAIAAGIENGEMRQLIAHNGKKLGSAWRKEHQLVFAGAVLALGV